jgi:hypothetical protein
MHTYYSIAQSQIQAQILLQMPTISTPTNQQNNKKKIQNKVTLCVPIGV